ncbi:MAG TPA: ATP phosphoribosyltransferase [Chthoniobacteraceae bacterium]|nr:ATP phosphoribosyltransferase [Chthoniobacteraceae bacterium]
MNTADRLLRVGLPSGSLQEPTIALFAKAGFNISSANRSYKPAVDDPELVIRMLRAQEISRYVEHGFLDCGLTGKDWIANNASDVAVLAEMVFSKVSSKPTRWVIAVPEDSPIKTVKDLQGKVIATEAVEMVRRYLARHGVTAEVEFSWGATEVKVPDLVDAIVDVTETGSSLRANKLRILETIMESVPQFIANKGALEDAWKKTKIEKLVLLLQGAYAARDKVGLKMNLPEARLAELLKALPALRNPTVAHLATPDWVAVETIIDESVVREIIPQLKALGAEGIIEYPLNKVVY